MVVNEKGIKNMVEEEKKRIVLDIGGMSCVTCAQTIEKRLPKLKGIIMKNQKDFINEKVDDLSLKHHRIFFADLHPVLQQSIWAMATREYREYISALQDSMALGGKG